MSVLSSSSQTPRPIATDPERRATQASSTSGASTATTSSASNTLVGNSIEELDLDVFLELMLTQLQSQDPLNPMDNQEMLGTISQIREIGANDKLSETLDSVLLGQNIATAAGLIGTEVEGITDSGRRVIGPVRQVEISDGQPVLELAVEATASAGKQKGEIEAGTHNYAVVWDVEGEPFGIQVPVDTEDFKEDFDGSIRLEGLPKLDEKVVRKVYRTDASGDMKLVGTLPNGTITTFTDALPEKKLGDVLPEGVNLIRYADAVKVKLSNVGSVQTLE